MDAELRGYSPDDPVCYLDCRDGRRIEFIHSSAMVGPGREQHFGTPCLYARLEGKAWERIGPQSTAIAARIAAEQSGAAEALAVLVGPGRASGSTR